MADAVLTLASTQVLGEFKDPHLLPTQIFISLFTKVKESFRLIRVRKIRVCSLGTSTEEGSLCPGLTNEQNGKDEWKEGRLRASA